MCGSNAAGNAQEGSAAISAALRFDPEPPALTFEPTDITDPLRVVVNAVDSHSGVASGEIEMRATGTSTWHGLATERRGSLLVAHVDDERFRRGAYEFRAHAVDQAGNEASTGRRADGSAATIRLPVRTDTRLAVGVPRLSFVTKLNSARGTGGSSGGEFGAWTAASLREPGASFASMASSQRPADNRSTARPSRPLKSVPEEHSCPLGSQRQAPTASSASR